MIGRFKNAAAAEETKEIIDELTKLMCSTDESERDANRFSDDALALLEKVKFHSVSRAELEQFAYNIPAEVKGDRIVITTDEPDVSAFLKLMIDKGAQVEVYSKHDYPDQDEKSDSES
jgi:hypothetical protein